MRYFSVSSVLLLDTVGKLEKLESFYLRDELSIFNNTFCATDFDSAQDVFYDRPNNFPNGKTKSFYKNEGIGRKPESWDGRPSESF